MSICKICKKEIPNSQVEDGYIDWCVKCVWKPIDNSNKLKRRYYKKHLGVNIREIEKRNKKYPNGKHTEEEWELKKLEYNYCCAYCRVHQDDIKPNGLGITITKDHVYPKSKGGSDNIDNIVPACWKCNSQKGTTVL